MSSKSLRMVCTRDVDFIAAQNAEAEQGDGRTLTGYAAVFNQNTEINSYEGRFVEQVARGAFKKTLSEGKFPLLQFNHGRDSRTGQVPIGVFTSLREDDHGLYVEARMFPNDLVEPIRQAIAAGAVSGMSFTFQVVRDSWYDNQGTEVRGDEIYRLLYDAGDRGPLKRVVREVKLMEAGPVCYPAYAGTEVAVRQLSEMTDEDREAMAAEYRKTMAEGVDTGPKAAADATGRVEAANGTIPELIRQGIAYGEALKNTDWTNFNANFGTNLNVTDVKAAYEAEQRRQREAALSHDGAPITREDVVSVGDSVGALIDVPDLGEAAAEVLVEEPAEEPDRSDMPSDEKQCECGESDCHCDEPADNEPAPEYKSEEVSAVVRDTLTETATPESNAAHSSTLRRDPQKEETSLNRAPVVRNKRVMTLAELRVRLAELDQRNAEINEEFEDRELSPEVQAEYDAAVVERARVEKSIAGIEARLETLKGTTTVERGSDRGPAVHIKRDDIFDLDALRRDSKSDYDLADKMRDNAMRAVEKGHYASVVRKEDAQEHIERILHSVDDSQGSFAKRVLVTGNPTYERAWSKTIAAGGPMGLAPEEWRALSLGTDANGGYAVPYQLDPTVIMTSAGTIDPLRSISRVEQIVGKEWQGITSAGTTVSRAAEAAEVGDNSFTLAQPVVRTNRVHGFVPFSYEVDDTWASVRSEITRALVDAKVREEAGSFMTGDGTGVNAGGVIGSLSGNTVAAGAGGTFTAANVYALEEALDPRWRTPSAKFIAHKAIYNKVRQFDTQGGAQLWERIGAGTPGELLGYQALESSAMDSTTVATKKFLLFGDFSNFLIVDRIGMQVELIPQVFGANQRPTGQRGIYAIWMNNSKILVPGAFKVLLGQA